MLDLDGQAAGRGARRRLRLDVDADGGLDRGRRRPAPAAGPGRTGSAVAAAEALARQLAGYRLAAGSDTAEDLSTRGRDAAGAARLGDAAALDLDQLWRPRPQRDRLRVPIGIGADGSVLELDIKEAAQDGMGPHGLLIGATGSGKSELLRTLVLGAGRARTPPEELNFVLVDFKGGATFAGAGRLPHTAAVITNLADELALVDRMHDALAGEMNRRQELLRRRRQLRLAARLRAGPASAARRWSRCPACWSSCDEFSELLAAASRTSSTCSCRSAGSAGRSACTCCWPASGWTRAAPRPGDPPVVPDRAAHVLRRGEPHRDRRAGRVRAAQRPRPRLPQGGHRTCSPGSRPPTSPAPYPRRRGRQASALAGPVDVRPFPAGSLPIPPAVAAAPRGRRPSPPRSEPTQPTHARVMVDQLAASGRRGAPGVAAAAGRPAAAGRAARRRWRDAPGPRLRRAARTAGACRSPIGPSTCRSSSAATRCWSTSPAPAATSASSAGRARGKSPCCAR